MQKYDNKKMEEEEAELIVQAKLVHANPNNNALQRYAAEKPIHLGLQHSLQTVCRDQSSPCVGWLSSFAKVTESPTASSFLTCWMGAFTTNLPPKGSDGLMHAH